MVSNAPVMELASLAQHAELGDLRVYYRGPEGTALPDDLPIVLDVRTLRAHPDGPADAPGSTLHIDADAVTVRISALNEDPVYYAANRLRGRFAYFTDLLLAPLVLPALGLAVEAAGDAPAHQRGTLLRAVERLRHSTVSRIRRSGGGWLADTADEHDPLGDFRMPHRADPLAAGEAQLEALATEIARIHAAAPDGTGYATLLSGGIDSGTVTYLAATGGLPVTPYSVGTPWGDELDDAAELCAELGIGLHPVHLSEDEIIASIPEAVRWLGAADPEVVEVTLTATSVQRLGAVPTDRVLLTGYGSDLINAGLYRPFEHGDDLIDQVLASVDRTRLTGELSNRMPLAYGTATHHPFWSWPVIRTALETAPECKVRGGREKYHLRTAMAARLPEPIAWRRKIAVHHGGGLQRGVMSRLEKETGTPRRELLYRACFAELLDRAAEGELEPTDPWLLFERAVRRVRAR
ncbi:asparagine synthase C-terminal domain-containing protein [Peterkaempfera bronchialis]|uniref:Asparagine synthase n=1 Tax=Peterkaempfera bronchialis TaxID=2126346 RepID=A0A345SYR3_9ACTN|nr:asparagine synthase C-terminal domain-containing protein [Peterkaempfera bronchialis]AXI78868.1 asparagine synthase [Peterkaempfera bronchialis]